MSPDAIIEIERSFMLISLKVRLKPDATTNF
jgi:hypothetical protein